MPLTALVRQLEQVPLTGEVLERIHRPQRLRLSGAGRAARALLERSATPELVCAQYLALIEAHLPDHKPLTPPVPAARSAPVAVGVGSVA